MSDVYLAIEIGGTKLQLFAGDDQCKIIERKRFDVERELGGEGIRRQIAITLPAMVEQWKPRALGVGFGGPVDSQTGQICCSHQIKGWTDFQMLEWLKPLVKIPVVIDNDANMAALGEAQHGSGQGFSPVFYVTLGSGVGGGLVVNELIYHGAKPGEAELGHVRLDRQGTTVESRCSGWAVDRKIRQLKQQNASTVLCQWLGDKPGGEAKFLSRALAQGDEAARRILNETAEDLGFALSHVTHLFHPQVMVLGGGLSLVGEPWRAAVAEALPRFIMEAFGKGPEVRLAALGEDAVPVGCLHAARNADC
jgi:glucokinase